MPGATASWNSSVESGRSSGLSALGVGTSGDAESLPFGDEMFDAVVNVESSHCYGSTPAFLAQVKRVLRCGGHFLFADLLDRSEDPS